MLRKQQTKFLPRINQKSSAVAVSRLVLNKKIRIFLSAHLLKYRFEFSILRLPLQNFYRYYYFFGLLSSFRHFQQVAESSQRIAVRYLITRIHATKVRKSAAVNHFGYRRYVGRIIQVLEHVDSQHQFQIVGLVAVLSFEIEWLDEFDPLAPRNNAVNLREKFPFLRPHLRQFVIRHVQAQLLIHMPIISHLGGFCIMRRCYNNSPIMI